jgi:lysozyme
MTAAAPPGGFFYFNEGEGMTRQVNDEGLALIKQWEGKYLTAYHGAADRPGLLTIGYGHTDAAGPPNITAGMKITERQATDILRSDLGKVEAAIERLVKVELTDNQFGALVAFVFNVGEGAFAGSTLLRKLNAGDYNAVPAELMKWTRANGKQVQGLVNRRAAEAGLWARGAPVASQYVEPDDAKPGVASSLMKPEVIATVAGSSGGVASALTGATGPVSYAIAAVIVIAAGIAAYYFFRRIREQGT